MIKKLHKIALLRLKGKNLFENSKNAKQNSRLPFLSVYYPPRSTSQGYKQHSHTQKQRQKP